MSDVARGVGCGVEFAAVVCGGDGEGGRDGVGVVVLLRVFAVEVCAFDVEEGAVQELKGVARVTGAL